MRVGVGIGVGVVLGFGVEQAWIHGGAGGAHPLKRV